MKKNLILTAVVLAVTGCSPQKANEMEIQHFITDLEQQIHPIYTASSEAYWKGATTGDEKAFEAYADYNMALTDIYADKASFEKLKAWKSQDIADPLLKRQVDILYLSFLGAQADTALQNAITRKESVLEQKYTAFRARYKGETINDNRVDHLLKTLTHSGDLQEVWEGHKAIGSEVAEDVLEIVRLRNRLARELGFDNYHTMSLTLDDQDPAAITTLFDQLDRLTQAGYGRLKDKMDRAFAKRYGVAVQDLMPWHFQDRFLQEAPNLFPVDLDRYYEGKSLEQLTIDFYRSIGLDVNGIMAHSDLYPREGKNQHAFCMDADNLGDIRVLCNITPNSNWMSTMLHEFGHAAYALGHDNPANPLFLREAAHTFTTEGVAMMFERQVNNPVWLRQMLGVSSQEADAISENCFHSLRLGKLVFSRWVQVVYRFEKAMYENPEQDLNALWWQLVEKYQLLRRPQGRNAPDWASKIHIALYPCYYHNYMLGDLFASQMHAYICRNITRNEDVRCESYVGNTDIGKWLNQSIFQPGMRLPWDKMIEEATGEKLTPKYYTEQFVK